MNLSNIKLIATDMDGTLLNGKGLVSIRFFELFQKLKQHDITFVAASGRQYFSIIDKLTDITNDITIIAENGAFTKKQDKELLLIDLKNHEVEKLVLLLRTFNDIEIILCGKKEAYIESKNLEFEKYLKEYYSKYKKVDDLTKIYNDNFLKIAVYCKHGSETQIYPHVKHLENDFQVKVSGEVWLDLSHQNANKGFALSKLQESLGIKKEETLVFGDYNNDLEMFNQAAIRIAVENAHPNIKKIATHITKSNNEQGVEIILEQLLASKSR